MLQCSLGQWLHAQERHKKVDKLDSNREKQMVAIEPVADAGGVSGNDMMNTTTRTNSKALADVIDSKVFPRSFQIPKILYNMWMSIT